MSTHASSSDTDRSLDTFPKLLCHQARLNPHGHANREKNRGIWLSWSWAQVRDEVRALACGLASRGFKRGDKLAIIGDNRPCLYWSMCAAQSLGGIPVPMYQDSVVAELQYVLEHSEARFAVAEDQEQIDKLVEIRAVYPALELIAYTDAKGMRHYDSEGLVKVDDLQAQGHVFDLAHPDFFDEQVAAGCGADVGIILYTSGTTGTPKGVVLSNDNVIRTARNGIGRDGLSRDEEVLAYLPMAWVGDNIFSYGQAYVAGFCVSCPENGETVLNDLREIGPTFFFAPPRIFENLLTTVMIRMENASAIKRYMFAFFIDVAKRAGRQILEGRSVSFVDRLLYAAGNLLVYGPLKNTLGLSRIRIAYTAGEAIGPDIFDFYRALGLNIKQLYGQTEAAVFITMQPDGEVRADSVGTAAPEVEIKIDGSGEVLYRSPGVFQCYYKDPEATAQTKTEDGWVRTGDAGFIEPDGHLKIIDRAKDVGKFNNGALFAPKYLENKLKFFPQIKEAVTFGDQCDYAAAFINIDLEAIGNWAERNSIPYASYQELANHEKVYQLIQSCVEQVNQDLSQSAELASSQIKRFLVLHKELDADDGELTRTRKVRRRIIAQKYRDLIEALYSGQDVCHIEAEMTYEDGRHGTIIADLKIREARCIPAREAA